MRRIKNCKKISEMKGMKDLNILESKNGWISIYILKSLGHKFIIINQIHRTTNKIIFKVQFIKSNSIKFIMNSKAYL